MFRVRFIILAMVLVLLTSCARIQLVARDGIPLPPETIQLTNPETGLRVESILVRYYELRCLKKLEFYN